jgi:acetylornithine deacetylase/succinyl-diaminopimelate desuccinylase-like protein
MNRLDAYIQQNEERFVSELQELCRHPSISAQDVGIEETAQFVADHLRRVGFTVTIDRPVEHAAPFICAEIGAGERTLLVYDHYDVQPPEPLDQWESNPFEPTVRQGRLYGRGVSDNKGPLMARIQAVEAYQTQLGGPPLKIKFLIEGEEEIGSPNLGRFVERNLERLRDADACLWEGGYRDPAGRQVISLGKKGMCYLELSTCGAKDDLHSSWGGVIVNPAWRLNWALSSLKDRDERIAIDGLWDYVVEPTEREWAMLRALPFPEKQIKHNFGVSQFVGGLTGERAVKAYLFEPTCTICGLISGYTGAGSKTVMPHRATAKVDVRLVPDLTPKLAFQLVRQHLDRRGFEDVEMTLLSELYPYRSDVDHPWVRRTIEAVTAFYGHTPVVEPSSAGGGPMYEICGKLGIPGIATGGVRHAMSNIHAPNENIYVGDYLETIRFTGYLLGVLGEA